MIKSFSFSLFFLLPFLLLAQVPKPEDVLGFRPGDDYKIADYLETSEYFRQVAEASPRVKLTEIGKTSFDQPMWLMFVSSEENLARLEDYRQISESLARARIPEAEARQISKDGKVVVWIDAGMHATERAGAQMVPHLLHRLVTEETDEMQKIRENVILLLCPNLNPDGQNIVTNWYKKQLGTPWETTRPPVLYQKYVGHDNNRDWFMNNMIETQNVNRILYQEWYPQIVHNHHQTSPSWARIFLPPFRSPVNQRIHPGVTTGVNLVGTAMANYFAMKKMPGVISGIRFSMWWNGGMRTAPYFHNMIGILTETAHATPTPRYYPPDSIPKRVGGITSNGSEIFYPYPWPGGESHFRDPIEYMTNASLGLLNLAADRKEEFLYNIYDMGRDAIDDPEEAYAYIIPQDQWDAGEAANLINILYRGGIEIEQADADFSVGGKTFSKGDFIVYGAQAFRPFLVDLLEKQEYPNQYRYPGGPPVPPYDLAGWTLPLQMGVTVERIDTSFTVGGTPLTDLYRFPEGEIHGRGEFGYAFSNRENRAYQVVNALLAQGEKLHQMVDSGSVKAGTFIVEKGPDTKDRLEKWASSTGLSFEAIAQAPSGPMKKLKPVKVGLYKSWRANMDEGWTRWVLEQHGFDLDTLHNADIQTGDLSVYSAIIIPDQSPNAILHGYPAGYMPPEYVGGLGLVGALKLDQFVRQGGVLIGFDEASDFLIEQFGLPVRNVTSRLSSSQFFIPGSLIRTQVDTDHRLALGMQEEAAASFSRSRAFEAVVPDREGEGGREETKPAPKPDLDVVVRYAEKDLLMSGWAKGEDKYLKEKEAMVDVRHGEGHVILFGFRPQFRGQPRGTYKLIFNSILLGAEE